MVNISISMAGLSLSECQRVIYITQDSRADMSQTPGLSVGTRLPPLGPAGRAAPPCQPAHLSVHVTSLQSSERACVLWACPALLVRPARKSSYNQRQPPSNQVLEVSRVKMVGSPASVGPWLESPHNHLHT